MPLVDEEPVDVLRVAAPGPDRAREEAGLIEMHDRQARRVPLRAEHLGDDAVVPRHVEHLVDVNPVDEIHELRATPS